MRILVLGADGMLGHQLVESWAPRHDLWATTRRASGAPDRAAPGRGPGAALPTPLPPGRLLTSVDARQEAALAGALEAARPEVVVNAIGIVKQRAEAEAAEPSLEINALLPHRLARLCGQAGARLVHLSTDCVFSGQKGGYTEADQPDPVDLYGRTKLLGEVSAPHVLTLRTSIIGLERDHRAGLVEWFLAQRGPVQAYRRAIWSGLTTAALARALEALLAGQPALHGVWHLASEPINKAALLRRLLVRLPGRDVQLVPDDAVVCDRSLDGRALLAKTSYRVPGWDAQLDELAEQILKREGSST